MRGSFSRNFSPILVRDIFLPCVSVFRAIDESPTPKNSFAWAIGSKFMRLFAQCFLNLDNIPLKVIVPLVTSKSN